jgi:hypothetical protein
MINSLDISICFILDLGSFTLRMLLSDALIHSYDMMLLRRSDSFIGQGPLVINDSFTTSLVLSPVLIHFTRADLIRSSGIGAVVLDDSFSVARYSHS